METFNYGFKDKNGNSISDQTGIKFAKSLNDKNIYKYFYLLQPHYGVNSALTRRWV